MCNIARAAPVLVVLWCVAVYSISCDILSRGCAALYRTMIDRVSLRGGAGGGAGGAGYAAVLWFTLQPL
jgi:hypothetical protein